MDEGNASGENDLSPYSGAALSSATWPLPSQAISGGAPQRGTGRRELHRGTSHPRHKGYNLRLCWQCPVGQIL